MSKLAREKHYMNLESQWEEACASLNKIQPLTLEQKRLFRKIFLRGAFAFFVAMLSALEASQPLPSLLHSTIDGLVNELVKGLSVIDWFSE